MILLYRTADTLFALLLINMLLVFGNVWPTPWPLVQFALSPELALLLLGLAVWRWRGGTLAGLRLSVVAAALVVLVLGRYADVTAPALYGRPVNLYWDLPHVTNVAGMLFRAAPVWLALVAIGTIGGILLALFLLLRAALSAVDRGLDLRTIQIGSAVAALAILGSWVSQLDTPAAQDEGWIAKPVTAAWFSQVTQLRRALAASDRRELPVSPPLESSLRALASRDVMVVFIESYGSVTDDRKSIVPDVTLARDELLVAAKEQGLVAMTGVVTSPTFGGNSWLAHLTFLSGIEVRDPELYSLLMTQDRPSLGTPFAAAGYRRVALLPGMKLDWPEGAFYRYDTILDERRLDYRGPEFGWWRIPDQFSLARLNALELDKRERAPVFAVFANVNTHLPFAPIPPLQSNWQQVQTSTPFEDAPLANALAREPNWTDMGQDYADSIRYTFSSLAGFLRVRGKAAPVMVLLGDHQPAASVAGPRARWDVPVHVLAPPGRIPEALRAAGFVDGMTPPATTLMPMSGLAPTLLGAFE